ncbi:sirohydrochlorin chelatase [soil metagenome]
MSDDRYGRGTSPLRRRSIQPSPILVAHGTRKASGVAMIGELADRVSVLLGARVRVAFVDVVGPTPSEVLASLDSAPAVLVPAFLSSGYHVRKDIPEEVAASGHPDVTVTQALGPCPQMVRVISDRLVEAGWRHGDSVIMTAAGTSDRHAQRDLRVTATLLSAAIGTRVELAYAATGEPRVADAVATARELGARRVVVASYLLADGLFQDRLRYSGADVVTEPLGLHPGTARLIANRFRRARVAVAA